MYEQEKQRATHLMILLCYTIFAIVLTGESMLLGWEMEAVVLLLFGLVACWAVHITGRLPESMRIWLYFILTMLAFFFYGIHETSIYDMAPVMIGVIIMYVSTEMSSIIWICVAVYNLTLFYDFFFVSGGSVELNRLVVTRILLHISLVYASGYLAQIMIRRRGKEKKETDEKITALREANRRTEDFLTNVSHELRTPINAVTGITSVMLKNEEDAGRRKDIRSVQMAGYRLFGQIEDILDYTEIDTGRIRVSEDTYMLSSIINDIISGNHMRDKDHAPELIFDIDTDIPSALIGDGRKIKKIIRHLVDNAVKFTKKGGVYVRIHALRKDYGVNLCIRVSDTGIGIAKEEFEKITERFYQSSGGRNRRAGGLGLGLPVVYGMVAAMEGFIRIESTVESGTTVSVSIPQKVADPSPCMELEDRTGLCPACFLRLEKFEVPEVRNYYNEMISHMVCGLDLTLHRVSGVDELERLMGMYQLTHLFTGREEYEENSAYFENLDRNIDIVVVADGGFSVPQGSRVRLLGKPFYGLPVIHMLNAGEMDDAELLKDKHMICPGVRVLVVDDEPMNLMVSQGIFRDYQMEVKTAESGIEALALCGKEDFDLIFLDHMMPEMDGVETLKRLRKLHADAERALTVVAFTANAVSGAREMFLREGFDEFVSKPIEYFELERVLRKLLPKSAVAYVDEVQEKESREEHAGERQSGEDAAARLEAIGLNTRSGMQYCRGDMEFYGELLTKFARDEAHKAAEIDGFFQREDTGNYRIMVHALKSAAKMVGADALSEMAKSAEDAAKKHDTEYIRAHHAQLLGDYRRLAEDILNVFASGADDSGDVSGQTASGEYTEVTADELIERLRELKESLDTCEADRAENLISEMSTFGVKGAAAGELLRGTLQDIEDFELRAASEKVEALILDLKGGETE